jgi:hypothetical protein
MTMPLNEAGVFRGRITRYGLNEAESGARSVYLEVRVEEAWDAASGEWVDWRGHEIETSGDIWIVKKNGQLNERQVRALIECAGWDGDLLSIAEGTWRPRPVQVVVGEDTYRDQTRYRINWINDYDRQPGGGNVDRDAAKELQKRYGSQLRAMAGNAKRNGPPETSAQPSPEAKGPKSPQAPPAADGAEDGIPF